MPPLIAFLQRFRLAPWAEYAVLLGLYVGLGLWLLPSHQWLLNPDGISYLCLADHWLAGRWAEVLNGYWSPLIVWLLIPLRAIGSDPAWAGHFLVMLTGLLPLSALVHFARRFNWPSGVRFGVGLLLVAMVLAATLATMVPDALSAGLVLWAVAIAFSGTFTTRRAMATAVLCALAYYAKAYNFYAIGAVAGMAWALWAWGRLRGKVALEGPSAKSLLLFTALWLLLCGPWIGALSSSYGKFTLSTAGPYNLAVMQQWEGRQAYEWAGLMPPVNSYAVSAWEDISRYDSLPYPSGLTVSQRLAAVSRGASFNLRRVGYWAYIHQLFWVMLPLLALGVKCLISRQKEYTGFVRYAFFIGLYLTGYILVLFEARYVWAVHWGLVLAGCWAAWRLLAGWLGHRLMVAMVVWGLWFCVAGWGLSLVPRAELAATRFQYTELHRAVNQFQAMGLNFQGHRTATATYHYHAGLCFSYLTGAKFYGCPAPNPAPAWMGGAPESQPSDSPPTEDYEAWLGLFRQHGIRWFLTWHAPVHVWEGRFRQYQAEEIWLYDLESPLDSSARPASPVLPF